MQSGIVIVFFIAVASAAVVPSIVLNQCENAKFNINVTIEMVVESVVIAGTPCTTGCLITRHTTAMIMSAAADSTKYLKVTKKTVKNAVANTDDVKFIKILPQGTNVPEPGPGELKSVVLTGPNNLQVNNYDIPFDVDTIIPVKENGEIDGATTLEKKPCSVGASSNCYSLTPAGITTTMVGGKLEINNIDVELKDHSSSVFTATIKPTKCSAAEIISSLYLIAVAKILLV